MQNKTDMIGKRFGRLTVIAFGEKHRYPCGSLRWKWKCRCDCGKETIVDATTLRRGVSKSCGCLASETTRTRSFKHGCANRKNIVPEYYSWKAMTRRCRDQQDDNYYLYGARGINVCNEWMDIRKFIADVGKRPSARHTLERIDNSIGYFPGNVKWALPKEQANNRRDNRVVEFNGKTQTIQKHCDDLGMRRGPVSSRLDRGWTVENTFSIPIKVYKPRRVKDILRTN